MFGYSSEQFFYCYFLYVIYASVLECNQLLNSLLLLDHIHLFNNPFYLLMKNQEVKKNPEFLKNVLELNGDTELIRALELSLNAINELDLDQLNRIGLNVYQRGKWTVNQILQHLIDWERIWCYRAILFARAEGSIPDAHDQEIMGKNSNANDLSVLQLVNELRAVRYATMALFESFDEKIRKTNCVFFEYEMPLYTIGLTITAHQIHHFNIIQERYVPLGGV